MLAIAPNWENMETRNIVISERSLNTPLSADPHLPPSTPIHEQPFIHAILFFKNLLKKMMDPTQESHALCSTCGTELFSTDSLTTLRDISSIDPGTFHFGVFLHELGRLKEEGTLMQQIKDRRDELLGQKEHWNSFVDELRKGKDGSFYSDIENVLKEGKLIANHAGCGGSYFLVDAQGIPRYVIKPVDEDIFCLNNRKEFGSPFNDLEHRVRDDIALYRSAQADAFTWEIALMAGLEGSTPKAVMGIVQNEKFYDFTTWIPDADKQKLISATGFPDKEKLCSIQEFIPESQDFIELLHDFYARDLTDEEIASHFDQDDFEQVCMLLWLTYDNDGHGGNFRTYVKSIDETGRKIYGIKKIDNGLSFPEKNTHYVNTLAWAPNATWPISKNLKQKIATLPMEKILERMDDYELKGSKGAFEQRIEILQTLAQRDGITVGEIDLRLYFLSKENGTDLALSTMTTQEILELLTGKQTEATTQTRSRGTNEAA